MLSLLVMESCLNLGTNGIKALNFFFNQRTQSMLVRVLARDVPLPEKIDFWSAQSLRVIGFPISQLKASQCFTLQELLGAGYLPQELKDSNLSGVAYSVKDLRLAGYLQPQLF